MAECKNPIRFYMKKIVSEIEDSLKENSEKEKSSLQTQPSSSSNPLLNQSNNDMIKR